MNDNIILEVNYNLVNPYLEVAVQRHHTRVVAVGQQVTLADGVARLVLRDEVALGPATNDER